MTKPSSTESPRALSQSELNAQIWNICNILRRSNCAGAMQYVPELTWILFLRVLDEREQTESFQREILGLPFTPSLQTPFRWRDWAAPHDAAIMDEGDVAQGWKRHELAGEGKLGAFKDWVNLTLLPHLKGLKDIPNATPRQKVISQAMSAVERVRIDTEFNMLEVLDRVHNLHTGGLSDETHFFALSQVFEGLLLKMGEKGNDGGQFFTPREVMRVMIEAIAPGDGERVYDPCCGTGGFLAQAYDYMSDNALKHENFEELDRLKHRTFYGREKEDMVYPVALANLVLHGIDEPHLWHGNTLTRHATYEGLWNDPPEQFEVILTNPPFGGKENVNAQTHFNFPTSATQILFLQHILDRLAPGGRCAVVVDERVLFRTGENAFYKTKERLLDECHLWCIVSLPSGTFINAGAGVKANILFFTKTDNNPTQSVWYYDMSRRKVGKKKPLLKEHFADFFELLPARADSDNSWSVSRSKLNELNLDLKAVNPHAMEVEDKRTPEELMEIIKHRSGEVNQSLALLRSLNI